LEVKDNNIRCNCLPHAWLPGLEQDFVQGQPLELLMKNIFQVKLNLLCERVLVQFLVTLKLLAGERLDSPLLGLMCLPGQ
jgi:hypothetical protein